MLKCTKCRLHSTCKTVKVDGRGSDHPFYFFIGEAPGGEEDELGKVFVGPSGKLLAQGIEKAGLKPCYISNIIKCRPPGDRRPRADEIKSCFPYLADEIRYRGRPSLVIVLGNTALKAVTGKESIGIYSGHLAGAFEGIPVMGLYHPAYILRYPYQVHKFEMGLRAIKEAGEKLKRGEALDNDGSTQAEWVKPERGMFWLSDHYEDFLTFDFETNGKHHQFDGRIRCMAVHTNGKTMLMDAEESPSSFRIFLDFFRTSDYIKCAHNSIFERRWFLDLFGKDVKNLRYDTMLLHYLMNENRSHDLESVASELLDERGWNIEPKMDANGWTWETTPLNVLGPYCGKDAAITHRIMWEFLGRKDGIKDLLTVYNKLLFPLSRLCASFESQGIKIDTKWCHKVMDDYTAQQEKASESAAAIPKVISYAREKTAINKNFTFNLSSSKQVCDILKLLGYDTKVKTKKGEMSVKKEAIEPLKDKHPFISLYYKYNETDNLISSYLDKFPRFADKQGLIHPSFQPAFQVTGRVSASNPPVENMPRDKRTRGMAVSRFEGGKIGNFDYSQLEMRLVASESGEERLIDLFNSGGDTHNNTAEDIFGKGYTKKQRDIAKNINFGTVYGIEKYSLARKFNVKLAQAEEFISRHKERNPKIYAWMRSQHEYILQHGQIKSRFGRVRRFPDIEILKKYPRELGRYFRQAGNFPIQSQGFDLTLMAAILLNKDMKRQGVKSLLLFIHHDSLVIDIYPGEEDKVEGLAREKMEVEVPKLCQWLKVKLSATSSISRRWGGLNDE